ncbi:MAG: Tad domain-containing protein [Planctomycetota bacterium]
MSSRAPERTDTDRFARRISRAGVRVATAPARRFHDDERGNVTMIMLALVIMFLGLLSSVFNTGTVVSEKIQLQTAADTAAYASSLHMAREVNLITAANINITLLKSARAVIMSQQASLADFGLNLSEHVRDIRDLIQAANALAAIPIVGPALAAPVYAFAAIYAAATAIDSARYFVLTLGTTQSQSSGWIEIGPNTGNLGGRIRDLHNFQRAVVNATPVTIENQRRMMESFYRCNIRITQPGRNIAGANNRIQANQVRHPVRQTSTGVEILTPMAQSFYGRFLGFLPIDIKDADWEGRNDDYDDLDLTVNRRGWVSRGRRERQVYNSALAEENSGVPEAEIGFGLAYAVNLIEQDFYVLHTQQAVLEEPSLSEADRDRFRTFVATAYREGGSSGEFMMGGPPREEPAFGTGVFFSGVNGGDTMMATAEAEIYNIVAESLRSAGVGILNSVPWQLWSTMGMNWQSRLTEFTSTRRALDGDSHLRNIWSRAGIETGGGDRARADRVMRH